MACGVCGSAGHNRRTHAEHDEPQDQALLDQAPRSDNGLLIPRPGVVAERGTVDPTESGEPFTLSMDVEYNPAGLEQFMVGRTSSVVGDEEDPPTSHGPDAGQTHDDESADRLPFPPWRTLLGPDEPIRITLPGVYELTAEEYHSYAVTGDWFSNSDAKALLNSCPAQFDYDRRNAVRKISDAFDFGHVWHAVILGKGEAYQVFEPKKLDGRTGPGKEQKAAVDAARAAGTTPIYGDQYALILAMAEAVKADPVPHALLTAPGRQEVCLFWYQKIKVSDPHNALYGQTVQVQRRAMIDHLPDMPDDPRESVRLVDGKTADHVKPDDDMRKKIYDYAYHRQAETYAAAVEALFNRDAEVVFIFQSKKAPHLIVPVELDTLAMRVAAAENRQAMEIWAECVATGEWLGYTNGVATSGVPAWIERQYDDEIGDI